MNTEKIEKLKKSLSNNLLPADLKPKIEAEIKRLEDLDSKQPKQAVKRGAKKTSNAKPSKTTKPKRTAMSLAKEIRKDGESWKDAIARASKMMKDKSHTATKDVENELNKLAEGGYLTDPTFGTFQNQVFADGGSVEKKYNMQFNVGKARYVINTYDGIKKHKDGSDFYDMHIFKTKPMFDEFQRKLIKEGYKYSYANGGGVDEWTHNLKYLTSKKVYFDITTGKVYPKMNLKPNMSKGKSIDEYDDKWFETLNDRDLATVQNYINNRKEFADGGEIEFQHSNLRIVGTGMDTNGNRVVKVSFPNQRPFSIQTNGNLPKTHTLLKDYDKNTNFSAKEIESMEDEIVDYVENYGSENQKKSLKVSGSWLDKDNYAKGGALTKYVKVYFVQGNYGSGFEDLTSHETFAEAKKERKIYDENERNYPHRVIERRVLRTDFEKGNYELGGGINEKTKKMRKQRLKKGDTVFVIGRRWFDRVNGNTYHTAEVEVNGQFVGKSRMTYGYDESYLETAKEILLEKYDFPRGMTERSPMWQLRDYGVLLNKSVIDGLKRDLAKGGGIKRKNGQTYNYGRVWTKDHNEFDKGSDHEVEYRRKKKFELGGTIVTDLAGHTGGSLGGDPTMLDGMSGTAYTGLVGETGAMSSGEMFMAGGTLPEGVNQSYMITEAFGNPAQHLAKGGGFREHNGRKYDIGRNWTKDHNEFDKTSEHEVEYRRKKSFFAKGGAMEKIKYDDVLEVLKEKLEESTEELPRGFDNYDSFTGEEVEKESRDGFIAYTDGGYEVTWFEYMSYFTSTGYSLPTKPLDDEMQRQVDYNYQLAKETFVENYPEIVEELGEENIDYNSLYEAGYESEAEELSEMEMDFDGEDSIMCQIGAYYFNNNNYRGIEGKHTLRLYGLVNLESPYHRRGNLDDSYDIDITFDSISELKEKVDAGLKEIIDWFDGKYYNDSDAEMKIRRMADGGELIVKNRYTLEKGMTEKEKENIEIIRDLIIIDDYKDVPKGYSLKPLKSYRASGMNFLIVEVTPPKGEKFNLKVNTYELRDIDSDNFADGGEFMTDPTFGNFQNQVFAKGGKVSPFKNIMETNTITEKEINLIKLRMNNDKVDEATQEVIDYIWDNSPQLTPDQNKKGIDYLRNLWKSPTGKERTNNPFGYREQDALETFEYFELRGFYDAGNRYRKFYVPLYTCVGADSSFEYAFYNGQVNILG